MSVACAWCQDLAARKADEALTDMVAKAVIEIASLREQLAQAEVAVNLAREAAGQWKSESEECSESYAHWFRSANDQAKLREQAEQERDEALAALAALEQEVVRLFPYAYDDGTSDEADPKECLQYAADEMQQLRRERDEARAEVKRITHNIVQTERHAVLLEQENARLRDLLNRILGDDGPDLSAYLDGHVETPSVPALQAQRSKLVDGLKEGDLRCASLLGDLEAAYRERDEARAEVAELRRKLASTQAELDCAKAFHDVAVKERDLARLKAQP